LVYRLGQRDPGEVKKTSADTLQAPRRAQQHATGGRDVSTRRLSFRIRRTSPLISIACYPPFGSI
jgi:hypothetical protein